MSPKDEDSAALDDTSRFTYELAEANQEYGVSSGEMWELLVRVARTMGWNLRTIATPNHVQGVLWRDDEDRQRVFLVASRSGDYDLTKLARVRTLAEQVEAGSVLPAEGLERLREIRRAPGPYGPLPNALAFVACGASFAVITGASWVDVVFGGLLSLASYALTLWAKRSKGVSTLVELLAAMVSAILASILATLLPHLNPQAVTLCAVIWFVPGFGLSIAPYELFAGNALSGLIWLTNASVTALKLVGGAAIGFALARSQWPLPANQPADGVGPAWSWAFAPLLAVGLAVLFRVRRRDLGWVVLGAWVVWCGLRVGHGLWQGTFLGTVALIVFAELCRRTLRLSSAAIVLPGIMLLVPGAAMLRALYAAQTQGPVAGLQAGAQVLLLVAAILGGVLVGNALISTLKMAKPRSADSATSPTGS